MLGRRPVSVLFCMLAGTLARSNSSVNSEVDGLVPNATTTIPFSGGSFGYDLMLRINITEIPSTERSIPNPHRITTTYDLSWTGANTFDQALSQHAVQNTSQHTLCSLVLRADFADSVIDAFDPQSPYLCNVPLGEACANAIFGSVYASDTDAHGCPKNVDVISLTECAGVLAAGGATWALSSAFGTGSNSTFHQGETIYTDLGEAHYGTNKTALAQEVAGRLQVVFLTIVDGGASDSASSLTTSICTIVDADYGSNSEDSPDADSEHGRNGNGGSRASAVGLLALLAVGLAWVVMF